jgi:hypothetical protein
MSAAFFCPQSIRNYSTKTPCSIFAAYKNSTMNFYPSSRVWVYMSDRILTDVEASDISLALKHFTKEWTAHGADLKATSEVRFNIFILLMVDESHAGASGCSIDKSIHFIQSVENKYELRLFNRLLFAWKAGDQVDISPLSDLQKLFDEGKITPETIVFDNTITTKKQLDESWMVPLKESWMYSRIRQNTEA